MPSGKQLPFDTLKSHRHSGKTKAVQMWPIASVWGHYSNIPLVQPWDTLLVEKAPAWTPHLWPLFQDDCQITIMCPTHFLTKLKSYWKPLRKELERKKKWPSGLWAMNKMKEKKRSKLIYSDQNCKKKVIPDVQRNLQTKSLTNLAKRYVNENQSSKPSYGDCDGPNIMTLK